MRVDLPEYCKAGHPFFAAQLAKPVNSAVYSTGMSALADHPFVKMNGLGNEIVLVDMRAAPTAITAAEARAAASPAGAPYDQLMALYPPRTADTDAYVRIFNND